MLAPAFLAFSLLNCALPHILSRVLTTYYRTTTQQYQLIQSFSLILLGMFLSSLATLNFSLALLVGLLASPLTLMQPWPNHGIVRWTRTALLNLVAPTSVLFIWSTTYHLDVGEVLKEAAFGWDVWGMYTPVMVWCVWWPAWLVGSIAVPRQPTAKAKAA